MHSNLTDIARARRLAALSSLPQRSDNVVSLCRLRTARRIAADAVPFVSARPRSEPVCLAA